MSEYQYYEFQAIDRPLTATEQANIRALSRRVQLTPNRAVFTYSYGDFPDDPMKVLAQHYDALLYLANWGSKQLAFRFPRSALDPEILEPYCTFDGVSLTTTSEYSVLNISPSDEEGLGWIEGEGLLAELVPLRAEIMRGDMRAPYLAWLKVAGYIDPSAQGDEDDAAEWAADAEDDDLAEPPVPAGLKELSEPLRAFIEFFDIDSDLIAVAAEDSPPLKQAAEPLERWVGMLSEAESSAFLIRLAHGESHLDVQLRRRLRELAGPQSNAPALMPQRSLAELAAATKQRKQHREEHERREAERLRLRRLEELAQREPSAWEHVTALISQKTTKAYDEAVFQLCELRELADHRGERAQFNARVDRIQAEYSRLSALTSRMRSAHLI